MADQIYADGPIDAPAKYIVPGSTEIVPVAVQALINGASASGDYVPTLIFRSQAGHVIARVPTSTTVTAGDDAEVSWFPGVKAGSAAALLESRVIWLWSVANNPLVSGVAKALTYNLFTGNSTAFAPLGYGTGPYAPTTVQNYRVHVDWTVNFPAGNYDRYIEIAQAVTFPPFSLFTDRARESVTPDGDSLTISAVVVGNPTAPSPISFNAFQASGVNKTVTGFLRAFGWPEIAGQNGWPG